MNVTITHAPLPGLPAPTGPHELAWSYILDAVFADAYHAGVGELQVILPTDRLTEDVEIRAQVSRRSAPGTRRAVANLAGGHGDYAAVDRAYQLRFGVMAPGVLRRVGQPRPGGLNQIMNLSCFTLAARLWGVPIRVAHAAKRPDLVDRAMAAMRRSFAAERDPYAFYQLSTWGTA